ncbi:MAG TPA: NAD(P)-dependent oxidoreductase [Acetobacteraceae bacterium]|nr:NAD(P)-dependent oxidoreductase [Acetobacteraceae bacterium]
MRVAFLGLGSMGLPMAANIAKAGHQLVLWNRSHKELRGFEGTSPPVANSPAEAVQHAEAVITMLADDNAVEQVVLRQGLLDALPADTVHVSMSTIGIATARRLADAFATKQRAYVAAPVYGRPDVAQQRKLWVVAAGEAKPLTKVRPLLEAVGRGVTEFGEVPWHANLAKLGNNVLLAAMLETFGEVNALLRKGGVDPKRFMEAANNLFQSPVYANYGAMAAEDRYEPALFQAPLGLKDLRLALAASDELAMPMPIASLARDSLLSAIAHGGGGKDWSVLASEPQRRG